MIIGYAGNPEPNDPIIYPLDEIEWDEVIDLNDLIVYSYWQNRLDEDPAIHFSKEKDWKATYFYILPGEKMIRHNNRWIDGPIDLSDYEEGTKWSDIVQDIREQAWKNFGDEQEALEESRGGSLNL
jgi:hypothetical protein